MLFVLLGPRRLRGARGRRLRRRLWSSSPARPGADRVREHAHRSMGPVWEANHVWLIFVLVVCWTAYPVAFGSIASTLAVPLFIARSGSSCAAPPTRCARGRAGARQRTVERVFALSSILTPFALGAAIGGDRLRPRSGRQRGGRPRDRAGSTRPRSLIGVLAVATAPTSPRCTSPPTRSGSANGPREPFRVRALAAGVVAGALALAGLLVLRADAPALFDGLITGAGLPALRVGRRRDGDAGAGLAPAFEPARYGPAPRWRRSSPAGPSPSSRPCCRADVEAAAAGHATLVAILIGLVVGLRSSSVPGVLFRLVLGGRFDPAAGDGPHAAPDARPPIFSCAGFAARARHASWPVSR